MSILASFPHVSQQSTITSDMKAPEDALFSCVPASIAACILWYQHKQQYDSTINPDMLKDRAYSDAYTGGTDAAAYVAICKQLGYNLYPIATGSATQAIAKAHSMIQQGLPVIFTQQDDYSPNPRYTHVCVWFAEGVGNLTAMDPFPTPNGAIIQYSDALWASRLRSTELWSIQPLNGELSMLQLTDPMGRYFVAKAPNVWHCTKTNADVHDAHLDFYRKYEGVFGLPLTGEIYLSNLPGTSLEIYERAIAIYDPRHTIDNPPGSGSVYLMHVDDGVAQQIIAKPIVDLLNQKISALEAQISSQANVAALEAELASYKQGLAQLQTALTSLEKIA